WDELCGEVLGRPLHHGPTRGGSEEQNRYHDLYSRTLESYEKWFEKTAPQDIWPPLERRFQAPSVTVRRQDFWLIRKPWMGKR
ncbi:MAG: TIGR04222 domain-containing membrane protein, partial [Acidobacteriota bacterium]